MPSVVSLSKASVLELRTFATKRPECAPPAEEGWVQFWHGYCQMAKVRSEKKRVNDKNAHSIPDYASKAMQEGELERQLFLNIIGNIGKDHINMFELGAGRGDWCLSLAGVIDYRLIPCQARTYRCLALEGEPTHYEWTKEHFADQNIKGTALHGAVQSHNGAVRFKAQAAPADNYGQSVNEQGNIVVPSFAFDTLVERYAFEHVDIVHMDVQGAEYDALLGAGGAIERGTVDYFLIGTHRPEINGRIRALLEDKYHFIVDIPCGAGLVETPLGQAWMPVDGCMLLQRKGIGRPTLGGDAGLDGCYVEKSTGLGPHAVEEQGGSPSFYSQAGGIHTYPGKIKTEEELAAYIVSQNPGLMERLKNWDIIGAAHILREWTSSFINIAEEPLLFEPADVVSAFHVFREKKRGVWCGGAGKFFKWVLQLFGIPAVRYNYSYPGQCSVSHLTTLFCDISDDSFGIYVADAYLNYYYVDARTDEMLRFEQLLQYIARKQYRLIETVYSSVCRSRISAVEIPATNRAMTEVFYPEGRKQFEGIRRYGLWEYPKTAVTWAGIMKGFNEDLEDYDVYKAGRTDEEFFFDLMLNKSLIDKFGISEVDARIDRLFEELGTDSSYIPDC